MSKFTSEMVDNYAEKLLFSLTKEENEMVLNEFDIIDENMELINKIADINNVEPMTHTLDDFEYTLREDEVEESIRVEDALKNCDLYDDREIEVPRVVGGEEA